MPSLKESLDASSRKADTRIADERRLSLVGGFEPETFNSWSEMEQHLVAKYGLEAATICLLQDFVGSESTATFGRLSAYEIEKHSVLIEVSVGYRMRLAVHLVGAVGESGIAARLPDTSEHRAIARCATSVFSRFVSDRVVGLMTERSGKNVAWLYLNRDGQVESASSAAEEFRNASFTRPGSQGGYFTEGISNYLDELIHELAAERDLGEDEGRAVAFALNADSGIVHCLLRVMSSDGFLLSICRDD